MFLVLGDIANAIWQMKEKINVAATKKWDFTYYQSIKEKLQASIDVGKTFNAFPMDPRRLVADVRSVVPDDGKPTTLHPKYSLAHLPPVIGIVCLDNGLYKIWFTRNYPVLIILSLSLSLSLSLYLSYSR